MSMPLRMLFEKPAMKLTVRCYDNSSDVSENILALMF